MSGVVWFNGHPYWSDDDGETFHRFPELTEARQEVIDAIASELRATKGIDADGSWFERLLTFVAGTDCGWAWALELLLDTAASQRVRP